MFPLKCNHFHGELANSIIVALSGNKRIRSRFCWRASESPPCPLGAELKEFPRACFCCVHVRHASCVGGLCTCPAWDCVRPLPSPQSPPSIITLGIICDRRQSCETKPRLFFFSVKKKSENNKDRPVPLDPVERGGDEVVMRWCWEMVVVVGGGCKPRDR